jgi:peptide/nickel transport system substrate-binding protein
LKYIQISEKGVTVKLAWIVVLFSGIALAGFAQKPVTGGTIVIAYYDEPSGLSPLVNPNGSAAMIGGVFASGLVNLSEQSGPTPDLAESWTVSEDGLIWRFTLRPNLKFSDGSDLTAEDVRFTFSRALDPKYRNPLSTLAENIDRMETEGASTFVVVLKKPSGLLTSMLARGIVPKRLLQAGEAAEAEFAKKPIGAGPFKLVEWKKGQLIFDANPLYYAGRPRLDRIIFRQFADPKKAWTSLMQGEADLVIDIDHEDFAVLEGDPRFATLEYMDTFCHTLLFNLKDPLFSQPRIRQAIASAIDRADLIAKALQGEGNGTTGPFKPGSWAYNADPALQAFDPARARKILADLGWRDVNGDWVLEKDGTPLQFTALIDKEDKLKEAVAKRLQWQLLQVGIRMDVEVLPLQDLLQTRLAPGNFQATIIQFNASGDPGSSMRLFWHSASIGMSNMASYRNPETDRLIDLGSTTSDFNARKPMYQRIHELLANDVPAVFLYYKKRYSALSSRLHLPGETPEGVRFDNTLKDWFVTKTK